MTLAAALICTITLAVNVAAQRVNGSAVGIDEFGKVNDHFYRGAQPKGANYEQLVAIGVKTIVDLCEEAGSEARVNAERVGLHYINLPMKKRSYPQPDTATRFLEAVNNQANWPVYVHCAGGRHRTGVMTAIYRMAVDGWNADQAFEEMKQFDFSTAWGYGCYKDYVYDYFRGLQARAQGKLHEPVTSHQ